MQMLHKGGASIMKTLSISKKEIAAMTAAEVEELATRLEMDNYSNAFDGLNDWHLLRAIAFQRPELVESYIHLLDLEPYDEA
ncbi:asl3112 [Nostoc sp. PCC 7120 = FACHB-418]|nr:asl3112 [Nostoc sp. PCC 7120 = FACHB-418]